MLPAASLAAELPTQITQSPGLQPTASTATFFEEHPIQPEDVCVQNQESYWLIQVVLQPYKLT